MDRTSARGTSIVSAGFSMRILSPMISVLSAWIVRPSWRKMISPGEAAAAVKPNAITEEKRPIQSTDLLHVAALGHPPSAGTRLTLLGSRLSAPGSRLTALPSDIRPRLPPVHGNAGASHPTGPLGAEEEHDVR